MSDTHPTLPCLATPLCCEQYANTQRSSKQSTSRRQLPPPTHLHTLLTLESHSTSIATRRTSNCRGGCTTHTHTRRHQQHIHSCAATAACCRQPTAVHTPYCLPQQLQPLPTTHQETSTPAAATNAAAAAATTATIVTHTKNLLLQPAVTTTTTTTAAPPLLARCYSQQCCHNRRYSHTTQGLTATQGCQHNLTPGCCTHVAAAYHRLLLLLPPPLLPLPPARPRNHAAAVAPCSSLLLLLLLLAPPPLLQ